MTEEEKLIAKLKATHSRWQVITQDLTEQSVYLAMVYGYEANEIKELLSDVS
jgi:hypothetical protein